MEFLSDLYLDKYNITIPTYCTLCNLIYCYVYDVIGYNNTRPDYCRQNLASSHPTGRDQRLCKFSHL